MRIGVVGAGGVGGLTAAFLARAGHDVALIARGRALDAIRRDGVRVDSPLGVFSARVEAADSAGAMAPVDAVLIAVKTWQVRDAVAAVSPMLGPRTFVIPLENGVEAEDECVRVVGRERVVGGFCRMFSWIAEPGKVRHEGAVPQYMFDSASGQGRLGPLQSALDEAGLHVSLPADFQAALWEKFIFIASFGGVGAIARATAGPLRAIPETRQLIVRVCEELRAVAAAKGVRVSDDVVRQTMAYVDAFPETTTASLQRDIVAGRPSEMDGLVGAGVRIAAAVGVRVPTLETIYGALLPIETAARKGSS